ncbi:MmgE/PrpD family protein [Profundibacterium mesophilum]|uniref:2-methylcitrate dehydratase n=1 Tax=Profundibacterium mesophilum KAUST100406-0324 TaxID=1037889 RepID=A0A921NVJ5_9RHOB|nr:MmgE/PrpD family protein [Profundibacterium mesophilum]KAF0677479.1 2-methylcitrate dehydratase [Profundibacterium mesophilum KAUST100406-0324]
MTTIEEGLLALGSGPRPPAAAREVMRLSFADWTACALAGAEEPSARAVGSLIRAEGGTPEATLVGGGRAPARGAALLNGTASHALDYDDTHFAHIGHPSVAVIPAALALAERCGASLDDCLEAALIGAEASIRMGLWLGRAHYQIGFHQTSTSGAVGAALAAARLLRLSPGQSAHALGLVATRASGLKSQFGTDGKPFNAGIAASNGVEAALLAGAGMTSRPDGFSCVQGFGATHHGEGDLAALDGIGTSWAFERVTHKFHACCHGLHAAIDAVASLREPCAGRDVARIEIATHPRWMSVCNIAVPRTGLEAKFSYAQTAAMAITGRDTGALETFCDTALDVPALSAMRARVHVLPDPHLSETQARVRLVLEGGEALTAERDTARVLDLPERRTLIAGKLRALLPDSQARALEAAVEGSDLSALVSVLSG